MLGNIENPGGVEPVSRPVYFLSDSTGITAETQGRKLGPEVTGQGGRCGVLPRVPVPAGGS